MDKPKIGIIGYGSMGKEVEKAAKERNLVITDIIDIDNPLDPAREYNFDVAIDFSLPDSVIKNIEILTQLNKNIVVGTTGWYERIDNVQNTVERAGTGLVWGSNFSLGMNMFFKIVKQAAELIEPLEQYDIMLHEMHHYRKKDSPSGSAESLAKLILDNLSRKKVVEPETAHDKIKPEQLHVSSTRGGEITGLHTVYIDSYADGLELTHRAKNRSGFAAGAVMAAQWLHGKKGFYSFENVLKNIWK